MLLGGEQKLKLKFSDRLKKILSREKLPEETELRGVGNILKKENLSRLFANKTSRILSILIIIIIASGIIFLPRYFKSRAAFSNANTQRTSVVRKGEISTTISGSGPIKSSGRSEIVARGITTVNKVYFKEGDRVNAGDLIAELDNTDAQLTVEKNRSSLLQTQMTQENNIEGLNSLNVRAPFKGQVTSIAVKEGSVISKNSPVLTIVDTSKLKALLQFSGPGMKEVTAGKKAVVYIQDFMEMLEGTLTYVSSTPYSTAAGGEIYNVEVEFNNPGSIAEGMTVSVDLDTSSGTISSINSGSLEYVNRTEIKCEGGGTVKDIIVKEKEHVNQGELLAVIENKELAVTMQTTDVKLKELEMQLETSIKQLEYYTIYSPIDGIIVSLDLKEGDSLKQGDVVCIVADDQNMEFSVSVDELDIEKLEVGQKVDITVDAIKETAVRPLSGTVSKIAIEGTSSNGVTTYPVTIKVDKADKLKIGMNADAEIFILRKTDVLYVPLEAIQRVGGKSYVMVKGDPKKIDEMKKNGTYIDIFSMRTQGGGNRNSSQAEGQSSRTQNTAVTDAVKQLQEYYKDAIPTPVEIGVNNETSIEITKGLNEGDVVILPPVQTGNTQTRGTQTGGNQAGGNQIRIPAGGIPMGGGIPAGGGTRR